MVSGGPWKGNWWYKSGVPEGGPPVTDVQARGVLALQGLRGHPRGRQHHIPHGVHPRDRGHHLAGRRIRVRGYGEGPVAPGEAPDSAIVGDIQPMPPGLLRRVVPGLNQECPVLRGAGPSLRGGGLAVADGEGTLVPEGCQQGFTLSGNMPSL